MFHAGQRPAGLAATGSCGCRCSSATSSWAPPSGWPSRWPPRRRHRRRRRARRCVLKLVVERVVRKQMQSTTSRRAPAARHQPARCHPPRRRPAGAGRASRPATSSSSPPSRASSLRSCRPGCVWLPFVLTLLVMVGRIYVGAHNPLDATAGWAPGCSSAAWSRRWSIDRPDGATVSERIERTYVITGSASGIGLRHHEAAAGRGSPGDRRRPARRRHHG